MSQNDGEYVLTDVDCSEEITWTKKDMRDALPVVPPAIEPDTERFFEDSSSVGDVGPTFIDPELREDMAPPEAIARRVSDASRNRLPSRAVGALFYRDKSGRNLRGTAFACVKKNLVMTAAHNVNSGGARGTPGEEYTDFVFVPNFGLDNYDVFRPFKVGLRSNWRNYSDKRYDYAFFVFRDTGNTIPIGFVYQRPYPQTWEAYGHPAQAPFDRFGLYVAQGRELRTLPAGVVAMDNNDMNEGSSGGPWVLSENGTYYANGLNSHHIPGKPRFMHSPFFRNKVYDDLQATLPYA
ncbi:trypsin-like peptidase domain-containing protein [Rhodobacteraceae bacterium R_SAG6]|nr:hypothetical protein [Rhodobacteraceae bacterium G21628-S1]NKX28743.1 trypsin-like peptidase domain-containing protein [Rhodobacteraceae bacterium R_SAG6]